MNTRLLLIGALVIVAIAVVVLFVPSNKVDQNSKSIVSDHVQIGATNNDSNLNQDTSNPSISRYIEYSLSSIHA